MGLADAEGGGDFLADRQALADSIACAGVFCLARRSDLRDHGRRDQVPLE